MRNGRFEPTLVVTVEAEIEGVVDAAASGIGEEDLGGDDWWWAVRERRLAPSQALAETLIEGGASGLLVRSFAKLAGPKDMNLVLWRWSEETVRVIDTEGRLPRP